MSGRTKIVGTLGPASEEPDVLDALLRAGLDVVRLNLSHGTVDEQLERVRQVRTASERVGRPVAVLADLPGPKVRAGSFPDGGVFLMEGSLLQLVAGDEESTSTGELVTVDYPTLLDDVGAGDAIVLGDGAIRLRAVAVTDGCVTARVETPGRVQGRPGVHLPSERMRLHAPTPQDLDLATAMTAVGVDFLALSFVRGADDIETLRAHVGANGPEIVAKIETAQALGCLDEILAASDAVMVARGDLGIECPLEDVPHTQKRIIRACVEQGVPVITATQMLESMITSPSPTRAEVSDVANAVFDGTDAVMLSAETAIGHDPVNVVRTMVRIADRAEDEASYEQWAARLAHTQRRDWPADAERITYALTHAASQAAHDIGVAAIVCCTRSGRTARAMARFRPGVPMVGLSPDPAVVRRLALSWGVLPLQMATQTSTDDLVWVAVEQVVAAGLVTEGDHVLVLAGAPDRPSGAATDVLRVVRIE
jgi:pyruvate kinase